MVCLLLWKSIVRSHHTAAIYEAHTEMGSMSLLGDLGVSLPGKFGKIRYPDMKF